MLKAYAHTYTMIDSHLGELAQQCKPRESGGFSADIRARQAIDATLQSALEQIAGHTELDAFRDHIDRILPKLREPYPAVDLAMELRYLRDTLHSGLRRMSFLYLPPLHANTYLHPLVGFAATVKAFPSTEAHIREGVRCHTFGLYTASVYHLMAVAQVGLYALANDLKVAFKFPLELAEWQSIIEAIETKIEPMRHLPRSTAKDEDLAFYSGCAVQFRYFKDAWRNHIAHMREAYDESQSFTICLHVRDFMEKLSTRISEI
ncbi:MAG TPA: hypothetical protein VGN01_11330 [Acidobacteriaceae bacterium]